MNKYFGRLCCSCREAAGLTQEQAAEILHVSVRTIGAYEAGEYIPHDETVDRMMTAYNSPELGYHYLSRVLRTGRRLLPQAGKAGIAATATRFRRSLRHAHPAADLLDDICDDDLIEEHEHEALGQCTETARKIASAAMEVLLMEECLRKRKAAPEGIRHGKKIILR